ncbi:MAG: GAF domain-containing protein [Anaerolineae bacterium]|nr:GAF domain-containing protein [Anaerolineae bacterium]MCA9894524.1 GAF domain-containing protein [Anaerolineae bacterium]
MLSFNPLIFIVNVCTLALALAFLLLILWYDARSSLNQLVALLLSFTIAWNLGIILVEISQSFQFGVPFFELGNFLAQVGFVASNALLYALLMRAVGITIRFFMPIALATLAVIVSYNSFVLIVGAIPSDFQVASINPAIILLFSALSLLIIWRYRQSNLSKLLVVGSIVVVLGHVSSLLNTSLGLGTLATSIGSIGALIIAISLVRSSIIVPLHSQGSQIKALHDVNLSITKRATESNALQGIVVQAAQWLDADAAAIFKAEGDTMRLVASYELPEALNDHQIQRGSGLVGQLLVDQQAVLVRQYNDDDFFLSKNVVGSVLAVPLIYDQKVIGGLVVICGRYSKIFQEEDLQQAELLAAQAAVSMSVNDLFLQQTSLLQSLTEAHNQLQAVIGSTENPVIAVDRSLRIIFANVKAREVLQLEDGDEGRSILGMVDVDLIPANFKEVVRVTRAGGTHSYALNIADREYLCQIAKLGEDRIEGWVAVLNDITELKELDRVKSEMIRMTSHDLKNPIQAALANLDLLRDDIEQAKVVDDTKYEIELSIGNIERQLSNMERIISGILDLERVKASGLNWELCSADVLLDNAVDLLAPIAAIKSIQFDVSVDATKLTFIGDRVQFERAIANLIENAIKFTPENGCVTVHVYNDADDIVFEITDTGIGIPENMQSHIFERFYRGEQPGAEDISGTGLGLSLVRTVLEKHQGRIWLKSEVGVGTTFYVSVRYQSEAVKLPQRQY